MTQLSSASDALALNERGMRALVAGDRAAAVDALRRAIALEPRRLAIWLNLAAAQRASSDIEGALSSIDEALKLDPRHFMALLSKASLLERTGAGKQAATAYGVALTQAPPDSVLDPHTLKAVQHARDLNSRHVEELEAYIHDELAEMRGQSLPAEAKRIDDFVGNVLGRRKNYRQDPAQFFYPGLPAIEFYERDHFPWLTDLEAATDAIRKEFLDALAADVDHFVPYIDYPDTIPVDQWATLNHSREWSAYHLILQGVVVEEAARRCPKTMNTVGLLPQPQVRGKSPAAMFSALRPRTRIPPHTGIANTRLVVHLPLIVPEGCGFRVGNETRQWREGHAWVFDDTIEHEAWNNSDQLRTILICDIWNPNLTEAERALIGQVMTAMDVFNETTTNAGL